jgi:hypothetical protein
LGDAGESLHDLNGLPNMRPHSIIVAHPRVSPLAESQTASWQVG